MPLRIPVRLVGRPSTPYRHAVSPRAFQLQCRRMQTVEPPKSGDAAADLQPMRRAEPDAQPPRPSTPSPSSPQDTNLLLMQIQAAQRAAQRKKFETPTHSGKLKNGQEDKSFHPALAGFLGGLMIAFGVSYMAYHFSGSYHVQKASQKLNKTLLEEQHRIAAAADPDKAEDEALDAEEITGWLRRASKYYSTFHPSSEKYVEARDQEIQKGMAQGANKVKEVENIAKDCAVELQKEIGPRNAGQNVFSGLVTGRTGWYIIMKHLGRIEEAVEGKEFVERRRQRAAKGIMDE